MSTRISDFFSRKSTMFVMIVAFVLALTVPAFAQTPVPIVLDTNQLFTSTNTWIEVFLPIMAIGIGISIALALLGFIGTQIVKAFRGGGR